MGTNITFSKKSGKRGKTSPLSKKDVTNITKARNTAFNEFSKLTKEELETIQETGEYTGTYKEVLDYVIKQELYKKPEEEVPEVVEE